MAEQAGYDPNATGKMDYAEHRRTYALFLNLVKYGSIGVVGLLIFMAVALVGNGGFIGGVILAAIFVAVAIFLAATGDASSMKH